MKNRNDSIAMMLVGFASMMISMGLVLALIVMFLWNSCLVPAVTGVQPITWLQAFGLMALVYLLQSFRGNGADSAQSPAYLSRYGYSKPKSNIEE